MLTWPTFFTIVVMSATFSGSSTIGKLGKSVSDISIVPPGYQFKEIGSKIVFTCTIGEHLVPGVTAGGKAEWPVFMWKDPNQALILANQNRIFSERNDAYKSKMYITNIEESDAGLYTCEVQTKEGLMIIASNNLFIYADIHFLSTSTKVETMLGSSPTLECEVIGDPQPDVSWKFNGRKLNKNGRYEIQRNGLRIRHVEVGDTGEYECRAQVVSQGNFKNLKINLDVLYAPILSLPLYSPRVVQGRDAKLECLAGGNPPVTYQWFKGNSKSGQRIHKGTSGTYVMRNVTKDNEFEYTCVVENKYGVQEGTIDLRISVPPKVKVPDKTLSVLEGDEIILPCEAVSSPVASFNWSKKNGTFVKIGNESIGKYLKIQQNNTKDEKWIIKTSDIGGSRLKIRNITRNDSGNYTCTAINEAGTDFQDVHVIVDFIPKVKINSSSDVYGWNGEKRELICEVFGHPLPTITWVKNRFSYLGSTPHHTITTTKKSIDTLTTILKLTFDEQLENSMYSNYSCTAKNLHGFETKTFSVRRAYQPDLPRNLTVVNVSYDSFSLKSYDEPRDPSIESRDNSINPPGQLINSPGNSINSPGNSINSPVYAINSPGYSTDPSIPPITYWIIKYKKTKHSPTTPQLSINNMKEYIVLNFTAGKTLKVEGLDSDTEYLVLVAVGNVVGESGAVKFNIHTAKFLEDEFFQADQGLMSKSSLTRQEHLRLNKHMDERNKAKSFWNNISIGLVVVVVGLLIVVTTVVLALAVKNWRRNLPAKSGKYRIGSPLKDKSQFDFRKQNVKVADEHDIDNLTMKVNRPRTSVNDDSPFADLKTRYGSLPKKFNDGTRCLRPFDVASNNNINSDNGIQQQQIGGEKKSWPMSSTLPRSRKMEVHVNRTASVMDIIEEKKTKQSQAWKDMLKLTTADLDEDSVVSRDDEEDGIANEEDNNAEDEGMFEDGNHDNLPPPPSDMLPSPVKVSLMMTSPQCCVTPSVVHSNVNVNCKQGAFDASHVDDDDDISFIDDDDEGDVIVTHHSVNGNASNKRVHFEGKSFKQQY